MTQIRHNGETNQPLFIFAHGAGAGMDHEFMTAVASGLATKGIQVLRFNFPYMEKREQAGKKRPPDRAPKLLEAYQQVIEEHSGAKVVIGGKSMGGRMASHLAHLPQVVGVACLGFPFHPPGKPENFKGEHLAKIEKPCLILQGERDTFGTQQECLQYPFSDQVRLTFLTDGDHSFKPRKRSGLSEQDNIKAAVAELSDFIFEVYNDK